VEWKRASRTEEGSDWGSSMAWRVDLGQVLPHEAGTLRFCQCLRLTRLTRFELAVGGSWWFVIEAVLLALRLDPRLSVGSRDAPRAEGRQGRHQVASKRLDCGLVKAEPRTCGSTCPGRVQSLLELRSLRLVGLA
jgi:hypothetical protein